MVQESPTNFQSHHPLVIWLQTAAREWPESVALATVDKRLGYSRLLGEASHVAAGMRPGGILVAERHSRRELTLLVHASAMAGACLLPLNPDLPEADRHALRDQLPPHCHLAAEDPLDLLVTKHWPSPGVSIADIRLLVATSGSSGQPKLVMLSGASLAAAATASNRRLRLQAGDLWLHCLPLAHVGGLAILHRCAAAGAGVLLHESFDAERVWADLQAHPATHLSLVPAMLDALLRVAGDTPPPMTLRHVLIGGASLDPSLAARAHRIGWPLCVSYGMSETGSQLATDCGPEAGGLPGCVGKPLPGLEVRVENGRISVRGAAVMAGYANAGWCLGEGLRDGWFITGDIGEMGADGSLRVLGRADTCLNSGGELIDPESVERELAHCPGVVAVGVSGRSDPVWGDVLVAFVEGTVEASEVDAWTREHMVGARRPRLFVKVDALPKTPLGKLRRDELRRWAESRSFKTNEMEFGSDSNGACFSDNRTI